MAKPETKSIVARGEIVLGYDKAGKAKVAKPGATLTVDLETADSLIAGGYAYASAADADAEAEAGKTDGGKGDGLQ